MSSLTFSKYFLRQSQINFASEKVATFSTCEPPPPRRSLFLIPINDELSNKFTHHLLPTLLRETKLGFYYYYSYRSLPGSSPQIAFPFHKHRPTTTTTGSAVDHIKLSLLNSHCPPPFVDHTTYSSGSSTQSKIKLPIPELLPRRRRLPSCNPSYTTAPQSFADCQQQSLRCTITLESCRSFQ